MRVGADVTNELGEVGWAAASEGVRFDVLVEAFDGVQLGGVAGQVVEGDLGLVGGDPVADETGAVGGVYRPVARMSSNSNLCPAATSHISRVDEAGWLGDRSNSIRYCKGVDTWTELGLQAWFYKNGFIFPG